MLAVGDVIAFSGKGAFSEVIKNVQRIKWPWSKRPPHCDISHVASVIGLGDRVLIMESTTLTTIPDAETKRLFKGVQMQFLSDRLSKYEGEVYWYPLSQPLLDAETARMLEWATKKHDEGTPYDTVQAMGAGVDFWDRLFGENREDFSKLFCSELVTKMLKEAGRIPAHVNASEETPADLLMREIFKSRVRVIP